MLCPAPCGVIRTVDENKRRQRLAVVRPCRAMKNDRANTGKEWMAERWGYTEVGNDQVTRRTAKIEEGMLGVDT